MLLTERQWFQSAEGKRKTLPKMILRINNLIIDSLTESSPCLYYEGRGIFFPKACEALPSNEYVKNERIRNIPGNGVLHDIPLFV